MINGKTTNNTVSYSESEKYILLEHSAQEHGIRVLAERTRTTYLSPDRIWPMLIEDPKMTRNQLKRAGVLYHQIIAAIRFNHFHRAANYLATFHSYCVECFGDDRYKLARNSLERRII